MDHSHFGGELGQEAGFLQCRVPATDDCNLLVTEKEPVAGCAGRESVAYQSLFGLQTEHYRAGTRRDDDSIRAVGRLVCFWVTDPYAKRAIGEFYSGDFGRHDFSPESCSLGPHVRHQLGSHDSLREAWEVFDFGSQHQLASRLVAGRRRFALDDQRGQVGPGGVDGCR